MNGRKRSPRIDRLEALFDAAGGMTEVAQLLDLRPQTISAWHDIPPEYVLRLERATGVSRHILRPDIFGPAEETAA